MDKDPTIYHYSTEEKVVFKSYLKHCLQQPKIVERGKEAANISVNKFEQFVRKVDKGKERKKGK